MSLADWLSYDPVTGLLTWKKTKGRANAGDVAGSIAKNGYVTVRIDGMLLYAHRIAWFLMTGIWPDRIDHANGKRHDNTWLNLRSVSQAENNRNALVKRTNKSGYKGVSAFGSGFRATITILGKAKHLGCFPDAKQAAQAYDDAAIAHHGKMAKTNKMLGLLP